MSLEPGSRANHINSESQAPPGHHSECQASSEPTEQNGHCSYVGEYRSITLYYMYVIDSLAKNTHTSTHTCNVYPHLHLYMQEHIYTFIAHFHIHQHFVNHAQNMT